MTTDSTAETAAAKPKKAGMGDVYRAMFKEPRVAIMLALGFSSGLPFLLTAGTLGYWLRDEGTTLKAIGFLSWVGFAYSFKFLWSPFIDRLDAPLVGKWLGRRRGWMLIAQAIVAAGLLAMAVIGPQGGLVLLGTVALVVAFASATQDIVVDAWRIEAAATSEELGLMSSAYQLGYRFAIITSDALILFIANHAGWPVSYGVMALLMGIGVWATLKATEPLRTRTASEEKAGQDALWTPRGFFDAVVGPFIAFFKTYAWLGLLMLAFISLYRLPEFVMGPMATPFYHDLGLSKDVVGAVRTSFGLAGSLAGIAVGGLAIARFGYMKGLIIGGIMQALAIASFGALALFADGMGTQAVTFPIFGMVMFFDNFGVAMAGVALVTYMSTLTSLGYTATQYALLSSTYAIVGKFLKGFSGVVVENIEAAGFSLMQSYGVFFVGAGAIGLPAVVLVIWLAMAQPRKTGPDATA